MSLHKSEAIVLRRQEIRETSLLLTAMTRDLGKIQGLVKGVRGARAAVPWYLEPLTLQSLVLYERKRSGVALISTFDLLDAFDPIRRDLARLSYASLCLDLVDQMVPWGDPQPFVFDLLLSTLHSLAEGAELRSAVRYLEAHLLRVSGLLPETETLSLSPGARLSLQQMLQTSFDRAGRLRLARAVEEELRGVLGALIHRTLDRELKTERFLIALGWEFPNRAEHEAAQIA